MARKDTSGGSTVLVDPIRSTTDTNGARASGGTGPTGPRTPSSGPGVISLPASLRTPRSRIQEDGGKGGAGRCNDVVVGDPSVAQTGLQDVLDAATGVALDQLLRGSDARLHKLMARLEEVSCDIEAQRRYGRPGRVAERRKAVFRGLETAARAYPDPEALPGAVFRMAGDFILNDCRPPVAWDDTVDPDCIVRGLRDSDGFGPVLISDGGDGGQTGGTVGIPLDGGGAGLPVPGGQRLIQYDFQCNVNAIRCRIPQERSDEFALQGFGSYEGDPVSVDPIEREGFRRVDPGSDTGTSIFLDDADFNVEDGSLNVTPAQAFRVRVKLSPSMPTRLALTLLPTERDLNDLQRGQVETILRAIADALVEQGLSAAGAAAQAVPLVGQALAGIIQLRAVSDALKAIIRPLVLRLVALFADPDRFTPYGFDIAFMWSDATRAPLVDFSVRGTTSDGFSFRETPFRIPRHPADGMGRVTPFVPCFQVRPLRPGTRLVGPGNYEIQYRTFTLKRDRIQLD